MVSAIQVATTAGQQADAARIATALVSEQLDDTFLVTNGDVLTTLDFESLVELLVREFLTGFEKVARCPTIMIKQDFDRIASRHSALRMRRISMQAVAI